MHEFEAILAPLNEYLTEDLIYLSRYVSKRSYS